MLEKCKPEDFSILGSKLVTDSFGHVIVNDVLKVDFVQIIGLAVLNGQGLGLNLLIAILLDVGQEELKLRLIGA